MVPGRWNSAIKFAAAIACCLVIIGFSSSNELAAADRWTSLHTNRTVEADFVGLWGDQVVLQMADRRVSVGIDDLVADSRILARRLAEDQHRRRSDMVSEIQEIAKEAAAPAPNPLPRPQAAPAYEPHPGGSLLDTAEWFNIQAESGHMLLAAYDALPPSYQGEVERLARTFVSKLDLNSTNQTIGSIHSVGDLIVTRQRWVFSWPRFEALPDELRDPLEKVLLSIGGLLREGLDPAELKLDEIKTRPFRAWLVDFDARTAPYLAEMNEQGRSFGGPEMKFDVVDEGEDKATMEVIVGEDKMPVNFVQVEGQWVFEEWNPEVFNEGVKKIDEMLESQAEGAMFSGGGALMVTAMINQGVGPMKQAETSRELHAHLDGLFASVQPMLAMVGQMAGAQIGGRRNPGFGDEYGGYEEYDEEMMGMDDMEDYEAEMMESMSGSGRSGGGF